MQHCTFYKLDIYTFCIISETAIWIDVGSQHLKGLDVRIYYIYTHTPSHTLYLTIHKEAGSAVNVSAMMATKSRERTLQQRCCCSATLHYTGVHV